MKQISKNNETAHVYQQKSWICQTEEQIERRRYHHVELKRSSLSDRDSLWKDNFKKKKFKVKCTNQIRQNGSIQYTQFQKEDNSFTSMRLYKVLLVLISVDL